LFILPAIHQEIALIFADDFRIFCGDLGNEVTDDVLARAFSRYPSFQKAKVVRDKRTNKTRGYGFVSFKDPNDFVRAMREMNGKLKHIILLHFVCLHFTVIFSSFLYVHFGEIM